MPGAAALPQLPLALDYFSCSFTPTAAQNLQPGPWHNAGWAWELSRPMLTLWGLSHRSRFLLPRLLGEGLVPYLHLGENSHIEAHAHSPPRPLPLTVNLSRSERDFRSQGCGYSDTAKRGGGVFICSRFAFSILICISWI